MGCVHFKLLLQLLDLALLDFELRLGLNRPAAHCFEGLARGFVALLPLLDLLLQLFDLVLQRCGVWCWWRGVGSLGGLRRGCRVHLFDDGLDEGGGEALA
jgi:hypothetical protein